MKYFSNTDNLFKQYSDLAESKKRIDAKKDDNNDALKEIVGYDQRFRLKKTTKNRGNPTMIKVPVSIAGMQHIVSVPKREGEAFISQLAERANHLIDELAHDHPGLSMFDLTVLALVNAMDQLNQSEEKRSRLAKQIKSLEDSKKILQSEYAQLQTINKALKNEVHRLKDVLQPSISSENDGVLENKKSAFPLEDLLSGSDRLTDISNDNSEKDNEA